MQFFQLVKGLDDSDVQEQVMADSAKESILDQKSIVSLAFAKETGKLNSNSITKL